VGSDAARLGAQRDRRRMGRRSRARSTAPSNTPSACCRRTWSTWTAIATARRRRSPTVRSACRLYPERIIVVAEGQIVCEYHRVFPRSTNRRAPQRFTTGGAISRSFNARLEPRVTARLSSNCRPPSGLCNSACSRRRAATARGSRFSPWSSSMTNRPCSSPSNLRWRSAPRPRRLS
jgi:hypothetical protein